MKFAIVASALAALTIAAPLEAATAPSNFPKLYSDRASSIREAIWKDLQAEIDLVSDTCTEGGTLVNPFIEAQPGKMMNLAGIIYVDVDADSNEVRKASGDLRKAVYEYESACDDGFVGIKNDRMYASTERIILLGELMQNAGRLDTTFT